MNKVVRKKVEGRGWSCVCLVGTGEEDAEKMGKKCKTDRGTQG